MVEPESLSHMVAAMANDITVMGLCGETRIANKTDSWVTMIQGMPMSPPQNLTWPQHTTSHNTLSTKQLPIFLYWYSI